MFEFIHTRIKFTPVSYAYCTVLLANRASWAGTSAAARVSSPTIAKMRFLVSAKTDEGQGNMGLAIPHTSTSHLRTPYRSSADCASVCMSFIACTDRRPIRRTIGSGTYRSMLRSINTIQRSPQRSVDHGQWASRRKTLTKIGRNFRDFGCWRASQAL